MADSFKFELVSPERLLVSQDVESVVVPGTEGEFTVLADHAPVMATVRPGVISVTTSGKTDRYVIFGGFADVSPSGCTILAEASVPVAEIDRDDLAQRIENAKEDITDAKDGDSRQRAQELLAHLETLQSGLAA